MTLPIISSNFICHHTGKGSFKSTTFSVEDADFDFKILPWGEAMIELRCTKNIPRDETPIDLSNIESIRKLRGRCLPKSQHGDFSGTTNDGIEITASRVFPDNMNQTYLDPISSQAEVEVLLTGDSSTVIHRLEDFTSADIRFHLVNLPLIGTDKFSLDHFNVCIRPIENYGQVTASLEHTRGMDITCYTLVSDVTQDKVTDIIIINLIRKLCLLLSLARGTKITWPCYDVISSDGNLLVTHYHNCPKSTFHHSASIDYIRQNETKEFLQTAYPNVDHSIANWGIDEAIELYCDSKFEAETITTRGIKAVICMEVLRSKFLQRHPAGEFIVNQESFDQKQKDLQKTIRDALKELFPEIEPSQLDMMSSHTPGLNRYSFSNSIKKMLAEINLPLPAKEIRRFVSIRNRLVHSGSYPDKETAYDDHQFVDRFIGTFLLATLGYIDQSKN